MRMNVNKIFVMLFCFILLGGVAHTQSNPDTHVRVELISERQTVRAGQPFWLGLHFKMQPEWHIYWKNPGDSGLPPGVRWMLPEGFSAAEIIWPMPRRLLSADLATYVYQDEILLSVKITPPPKISQKIIQIGARVDWLECREICVPGSAELSIELQLAEKIIDSTPSALFGNQREALPRNADFMSAQFSIRDSLLEVHFPRGAFPDAPRQMYFFPDSPDLIQHAAKQSIRLSADSIQLSIPLNPFGVLPESAISGVLQVMGGNGEALKYQFTKIKRQTDKF